MTLAFSDKIDMSLDVSNNPSLSVIVPTYCEAANLPSLVDRVESVARSHRIDLEMLVIDDSSPDETRQVIKALNRPWVRLVVRTATRDLSASVVEGFSLARHEILAVMDADLSHPPEVIPQMLEAIRQGSDS